MIVYLDSSALLKRVVAEAESSELVAELRTAHTTGDLLVASSIAWIEVERALRRAMPGKVASDLAVGALSGVFEAAVDAPVVRLARQLDAPLLRTLDAIHVATALLVDADRLLAYDDRLITAARDHGLVVDTPGRPGE